MNKTSKFNKKDADAATSISKKNTNKVNKQPSSGDENAALDAFFKEDDSDDYDDDEDGESNGSNGEASTSTTIERNNSRGRGRRVFGKSRGRGGGDFGAVVGEGPW